MASWRRAWDQVIPFFAFAPEVRQVIYTTNTIESVHAQLRKIIKTRVHFPSDDAATKLIWLALRNITADWSHSAREWRAAMSPLAIAYDDRFTAASRRPALDHTRFFRNGFITCPYGDGQEVIDFVNALPYHRAAAITAERLDVKLYNPNATPILVKCEWH